MRRPTSLVVMAAVSAAFATLPSAPARADVADVWTTYPSMAACKAGLADLVQLNDYCYGLADGRAIGLSDAALAVDELDQATGTPYDDENLIPAPEGPANPVVEVWNNTNLYTLISPGTSTVQDVRSGTPIYFVAPHTDATGVPVDADGTNALSTSTSSGTFFGFGGAIGGYGSSYLGVG